MVIKIGDKISNFELEAFHDNQIKKIKLNDFKDKWLVFVFYPADFTFVCPTELADLANHYSEFKKLNAEVFGVSTDSVYVHMAWHNFSPLVNKVNYPLIADPSGKLCKIFGTYLEDEGVSLRGSFIVDPNGVIRTIEIHDNNIGRSAAELLRKLQAAVFVNENEGMVCPANWKPGEKAIKPELNSIEKR